MDKDDKQLFADAVKDVTRLDAPAHHQNPRRNNQAKPTYHLNYNEPSASISSWISGDEVLKNGKNITNTQAFYDLSRGRISAEKTLDLHNYTLEEAQRLLRDFFSYPIKQHCIRIVHGKGLHSDDGRALLKSFVADYLHSQNQVSAYHSCVPNQGGTGAVLVLLK